MSLVNESVPLAFFKTHPGATPPDRQTDGAAGYDITACLDTPITINPNERSGIPTGLRISIPRGYVLSVRPRSGLAINHGITLINSPGTIDADFRGEIKILLVNLGSEPFVINHGDRIAQVLLEKTYDIKWHETDILEKTIRGENGFGSTGK